MTECLLDDFDGTLLNPMSEPVFKALFSDDSVEGQLALKSLVEVLLGKEVSDVNLIKDSNKSLENSVVRFSCGFKGEKGIQEIKIQSRDDFGGINNRAEYYIASLLNHCSKECEDWDNVPGTYDISLLNFIYDVTDEDGLSHYVMRKENGSTLNRRMNVVFLEVPKLMCPCDAGVVEMSSLERWCNFFLFVADSDQREFVERLVLSDEGIKNAYLVLKKLSQSEFYWQLQQDFFDRKVTLNSIKKYAHETGYTEGRILGKAEGIEMEKMNLASRLFESKLFTEVQICELTGLTLDRIESIKSIA